MNKTLKPLVIILSLLLILIFILWGLGGALVPLIFSFSLAYLVFPIVKKLETKGIHRNYSVPGLFSALIILLILISALVLPAVIKDGQTFLKDLPINSVKAVHKIENFLQNFGHPVGLSQDSIQEYLEEHISEVSSGFLKILSQSIKSSFTGISKWLIAILNLFLIPLFFFYVINDYEKLANELKSFIPQSIIPKLKHYLALTNKVLSGYIRGQLMVALALAILYAIGLTVVGLKFGFLIGILSGLISIIPYAGFTIGFLSAIIVALANYTGMSQIIGIISVFVFVQTLEGMFITPKLVGDKVGLSAFTTMLALIVGGNLLGLIGMVIAIPITAIIKSIVGELKEQYQQLEFFK